MSQGQKIQDLMETGETLVGFIESSQPENLIRVKTAHQALIDHNTGIKNIVTQILKDVAQTEESVGQKLLNMEEEKKEVQRKMDDLEEQLRQCRIRSQNTDSELQFLQGELESLRAQEDELTTLQSQVDEDTTEVIPSAVYVAQLYYQLTKIKWEYDTPPGILRGVQYRADLATPIDIDTSTRSPADVSDQLWDLISTEW